MATPEQISALRLLIAEPTADEYDDEALATRLDAADSEYAVASEIWIEKAAQTATLVDVIEGGSHRKMGDIHEQMLAMAKELNRRASAEPTSGESGVRIRNLSRP
jgi:hypothetical protein